MRTVEHADIDIESETAQAMVQLEYRNAATGRPLTHSEVRQMRKREQEWDKQYAERVRWVVYGSEEKRTVSGSVPIQQNYEREAAADFRAAHPEIVAAWREAQAEISASEWSRQVDAAAMSLEMRDGSYDHHLQTQCLSADEWREQTDAVARIGRHMVVRGTVTGRLEHVAHDEWRAGIPVCTLDDGPCTEPCTCYPTK